MSNPSTKVKAHVHLPPKRWFWSPVLGIGFCGSTRRPSFFAWLTSLASTVRITTKIDAVSNEIRARRCRTVSLGARSRGAVHVTRAKDGAHQSDVRGPNVTAPARRVYGTHFYAQSSRVCATTRQRDLKFALGAALVAGRPSTIRGREDAQIARINGAGSSAAYMGRGDRRQNAHSLRASRSGTLYQHPRRMLKTAIF